ncbi:MAG: GAF domain-containing protein, partial [Anaerolineae bacterium]|nr:GAF domain-containing protein [Anaerolineae bacterium]
MTKPDSSTNGRTGQEKLVRQLAVLQHTSRLIAANESSAEDILLSVLGHLLDDMGYRAAQIYRISASSSDLWLYQEVGPGSKPVTQNRDVFSLDDQNIVSAAVHRDEPIYVADIGQGPYPYHGQEDERPPSGSELAVPLKSGERSLGVLRVQSDKLDAFDEVDVDFFVSLAHLLASAVRNSREIQQLKDNIQDLKTLYQPPSRGNLDPQQAGRQHPVAY